MTFTFAVSDETRAPSVLDAVIVHEVLAVLKVKLKVLLPEVSAAFPGRTAFASSLVIAAVGDVDAFVFHQSSQASTVMVNCAPAVLSLGAPLLPFTVPGCLDCPGR
ncbi:hypothetical protein KKF70_08455, partial [bacterium]|nr:hypothetical protein [bacterium]